MEHRSLLAPPPGSLHNHTGWFYPLQAFCLGVHDSNVFSLQKVKSQEGRGDVTGATVLLVQGLLSVQSICVVDFLV